MNDAKLVSMLRCPVDGSPLAFASSQTISRLNEAIQNGRLRDQNDQKVTLTLDGGLVARESGRLYPIRGDIPSLVADEAINLSQLD